MPRPRAPTRDLFEFTNRRRTGGKCDLYRCRRCGREMLENTHRFAIHISICKQATDEDREVAKGQLRKTKKYSLKFNKQSPPSVPEPELHHRDEISAYQSDYLASPLSAQETLPMKNYYPHHHQHSRLDVFEPHLSSAPPFFEPQSRPTAPMFDLDNHYRTVAPGMFENHPSRTAAAPPPVSASGIIFDNHQSRSNPSMMFDHRPHPPMPRQHYQISPSSYQHSWGSSMFPSSFEPQGLRAMSNMQQYMF